MTTNEPIRAEVTPGAALMALNLIEASLDSAELARNTLDVHLAKLVETDETAAAHLTDTMTGALLAASAWAASFMHHAEANGVDIRGSITIARLDLDAQTSGDPLTGDGTLES